MAREVPQESTASTRRGSRQRCVRCRGTGTVLVPRIDEARDVPSHPRETRCPVPGCVDGWVIINVDADDHDEDHHIEYPEQPAAMLSRTVRATDDMMTTR